MAVHTLEHRGRTLTVQTWVDGSDNVARLLVDSDQVDEQRNSRIDRATLKHGDITVVLSWWSTRPGAVMRSGREDRRRLAADAQDHVRVSARHPPAPTLADETGASGVIRRAARRGRRGLGRRRRIRRRSAPPLLPRIDWSWLPDLSLSWLLPNVSLPEWVQALSES